MENEEFHNLKIFLPRRTISSKSFLLTRTISNRYIFISFDTFLYYMRQKCNYLRVLEIFFIEPTTIHSIRGISKRINLAPISVKKYIKKMIKEGLVKKKFARPFNGFIANRENKDFIFYKRTYNLYSLKDLNEYLVQNLWPKLIVVFGSYSRGEDIEKSDIDILIVSKVKRQITLKNFEKKLERKINLLIVDKLSNLDRKIIKKIYDGIVLYGGF